MKIGTKIKIKAYAFPTLEPIKDNSPPTYYRKYIPLKTRSPMIGYYTGYTYKQEGIYTPPYYPSKDGDYQLDGSLTQIKPLKLARFKLHERQNDRFAFFEDIEEITE